MSTIETTLYPCCVCNKEHERHALILEAKHFFCRGCWEKIFEERMESPNGKEKLHEAYGNDGSGKRDEGSPLV